MSVCIGLLYVNNRILADNRALIIKRSTYYKTNLSREEMKHALYLSVNDSTAIMVPGDSSVMPYLIRFNSKIKK
jgi:hypothetical protein